MSQENVEGIKRAFEAFDRGDYDAVLALCDEDIVITQPPELPGAPSILHGHAGVLESFELWPEQWDEYRIEMLDIRDLGSRVLVSTQTFGRGKQSGIEVEARVFGSFVIVAYAAIVGSRSFGYHAMSAIAVAVLVGFSLVVLLDLSFPFSGDFSIEPDAFKEGALAQFFPA